MPPAFGGNSPLRDRLNAVVRPAYTSFGSGTNGEDLEVGVVSDRNLELLILLLVDHDSGMSSYDLVAKVAQARNLSLPSGRVYDIAYSDIVKDVREAKSVLRSKRLLAFGKSGRPKMLPAGRSFLEKMRVLLEKEQ